MAAGRDIKGRSLASGVPVRLPESACKFEFAHLREVDSYGKLSWLDRLSSSNYWK